MRAYARVSGFGFCRVLGFSVRSSLSLLVLVSLNSLTGTYV